MFGSPRNSLIWVTSAVAVLVGCGEPSSADHDVTTRTSAILGNTTLTQADLDATGLVAVYHPKLPLYPNFYKRPCSGVIIKSWTPPRSPTPISYILTARHCATVDEGILTNLAAPSALRVSHTTNPGAALPNPPSDALTPTSIIDLYPDVSDSVLLVVPVDWSAVSAQHPLGLYVGDVGSAVGVTLTAYGYGINAVDNNCSTDDNTTGAGQARSSPGVVISQSYDDGGANLDYEYNNLNSNGQSIVVCGDSGGPDESLFNSFLGTSRFVMGVHTGPNFANMKSVSIGKKLQTALGGLFLRPIGNTGYEIGVNSDGSMGFFQSGVFFWSQTVYDRATKLLTMSGQCLGMGVATVNGAFAFVPHAQATCDATNPLQQWDITPGFQVRNIGLNLCMSSTGVNDITLTTCVPNELPFAPAPSQQQWLITAQP